MKNTKLVLIAFLITFTIALHAQVSVNVNIGTRPAWGPVYTTQEYYYLPDIDSYYDIRQSQFIYLNNGVWIRSRNLPRRYRSYNLNTGTIIVLNDYHGRNPYAHYKTHKVKYYNNNNNWKKDKEDNHRDNSNHSEKKNGKGNNKQKKGKH